MAIRIELSELKRISGRTTDINSELARDLSEMVNELNNVCNNVRSSELTAANADLTSVINTISNRIKTNLPQIIAFLNKQVDAYGATNETTRAAIDNLVSSIDKSFGGSNSSSNMIN